MTKWPEPGMLILLSMLVGTATINVNTYIPAMPAIGLDTGASAQLVQLSLAVFMWGYALGQLVVGPLSDRYGRLSVLRWGLISYTVVNFVSAFAQQIETLLFLRILQGLIAATGPVLVRAILNDRLDSTAAARTLSSALSIMALVPALAPIISGFLVEIYGWQSIFFMTSLFCLTLLVLSNLLLEESLPDSLRSDGVHPRQILHGYFEITKVLGFWRYSIVATGMFCSMFAYNAVNSFLIINDLGIAPRYHGMSFALIACAFIIGSIAGNHATKYYSADQVITWGIFIALLSAAGACWYSASAPLSLALVLIPGALVFFANGLALPGALSLAIGSSPNRRGSASALAGFMQIGCAGIIGSIAGKTYDHTTGPLHELMFITAAIAAIGWYVVGIITSKTTFKR